VREYCRCSADPVGRIVLALFGYRDPERRARADEHLHRAPSLTNFWQDVAGDLARGRVYIPAGGSRSLPREPRRAGGWRHERRLRRLLAFEVAERATSSRAGLALAGMVRGRLAREVRLFARAARHPGRIAAADYDVFARRPTLTRGDLARPRAARAPRMDAIAALDSHGARSPPPTITASDHAPRLVQLLLRLPPAPHERRRASAPLRLLSLGRRRSPTSPAPPATQRACSRAGAPSWRQSTPAAPRHPIGVALADTAERFAIHVSTSRP